MWSLTDYCTSFESSQSASWDDLAPSSRAFLEQLDLPSVHPFCQDSLLLELYNNSNHHHHQGQQTWTNDNEAALLLTTSSTAASVTTATVAAVANLAPPMGPMQNSVHENVVDAMITIFYMKFTPYLAFAHLWFRLFAGIIAPLCILILLRAEEQAFHLQQRQQQQRRRKVSEDVDTTQSSNRRAATVTTLTSTLTNRHRRLPWTCLLGSLCSMVVMTDSLYVYEFGTYHGVTLFIASILLGVRACLRQYRQLLEQQDQASVQEPRHQQQEKASLKHQQQQQQQQRQFLKLCLFGYILEFAVAMRLTWDGSPLNEFHFGERADVDIQFPPGLYYNSNNSLIRSLVDFWPVGMRTYSADKMSSSFPSSPLPVSTLSPLKNASTTVHQTSRPATTSTRQPQSVVPTPWMYTGDARTGLPFFLNSGLPNCFWKRVFLTVPDDIRDNPLQEEVLALDVAFPETGHDPTKPIYLILHGINGGSSEDYVKDLALRRTAAGSTVIVMVARGLMDMPLRGYGIFHASRWSDVHAAATTIRRRVLQDGQILAGVGYSMGAIVLNNYAASSGKECALDAAFTISGALDCRYEQNYTRSQMTWLPIVAEASRASQHLPKWGSRLEQRLTRKELVAMMRARHTVVVDRYTAFTYYSDRFMSLEDYYAQQSALGDIPLEDMKLHPRDVPSAKIHNLSIPLCILHALDDPISTWRTNAANEGFMYPGNLVQTGNGNLMLLFTKTGGHVGWPVGWMSWRYHWEFMSEAAASFVDAVDMAKKQLSQPSS